MRSSSSQLPIVYPDDRPRARRTDPPGSHAAADEMQLSGQLARQQELVLRLVREYPGLTSKMLAASGEARRMKLDYHAIARRLPELEDKKFIRAAGRKQHPHETQKPLRWYPAMSCKNEKERLGA